MSGSVIASNRLARERSRTDPGHVSRIPSRSPHIPSTPRVPPPVSTFSTPGRATYGTAPSRRYAAISDSSGSELNLQGEHGRALFVTNAVIVPSSSSSSEEVEASQPVPNVDPPARSSHLAQRSYPYDRRPTQSGIGLGLGPPARMSHIHSHSRSHAVSPPSSSRPGANIDNDHYIDLGDEDAASLAVSSSSSSAYLRSLVLNRRTLRTPNLSRNTSTISGSILPNPWDSSDVRPNESDQRRRELIELVNEMDHGSQGSVQPYDYDSLSDEYAGEQGLAISPSDDFGDNTNESLRPGGGDNLRRRSPVSGTSQATPRQPYTREALAGEQIEYSPLSHLPSSLGRVDKQTVETHRKDQEPDFSPLSEYSDDEDYGTNNPVPSPPSHRNHRSPLAQDLFRSKREGDHPLQPLESSRRAPIASPVLPVSTRCSSSGTGGCSEKAPRTNRESPVARSPKANFHGAHSSCGTRSLSRARERNGMQRSPACASNVPFPHTDSTSSVSSLRWRDEDKDISVNAEAIFEQLSTGRQSAAVGNSSAESQWQGIGRKPPTIHPINTPSPREAPDLRPQPVVDLPESHNTQRAYGGANTLLLPQHDQRSSQSFVLEQRTWLSTISSSAYHSLLDRYGEVEMERQQVIWDLCETERAFVRRLRTFVRLFIRPLRMKDSVTWLAGVPPEVARLFDWLEDIINIHAQISSALRVIVSEQYPIVMRIAGKVRSFVSHLEVHQPYVVRLETTTLLIKRLTAESGSDFGEFIRIQQEQDECHGWSVESFLVEPVNRLVDYPIHFRVCTEPSPFCIENLSSSPSGSWM
jgi:RhoGEF domain